MKILTIGCDFHTQNGTGITLLNMFGFIPKQNVFVVSATDFSLLSLESGYHNVFDIRINKAITAKNRANGNTPRYQHKRGFVKEVLHRIKVYLVKHGLYHQMNRSRLTPELCSWIEKLRPDIIYSVSFVIPLTLQIQKKYKLPIVTHIMDDWIQTEVNPGPLHWYWQNKVHQQLRALINASSAHIAISPLMAEVYKKRHNCDWEVIHNPVSLEKWLLFQKNDYSISESFKIAYFGRYTGANKMIMDKLIEVFNTKRFSTNTEFHLYSDIEQENSSTVYYHGFIKHHDLPASFMQQDLLILPFMYDDKWNKYVWLSMPTKVSEYMISGVPTLLISDKFNSVYRFFIDNDCAFFCESLESDSLIKIIDSIIRNSDLRAQKATRAKQIAMDSFSTETVQRRFESILNKTINLKANV